MTARLLRWRDWTRRALLERLAADLDAGPAPRLELAQQAADASLGVDASPPPGLTTYRRAEGSTVWHWRPSCPHWPDPPWVEHLGEPGLGQKCRECAGPGIPP